MTVAEAVQHCIALGIARLDAQMLLLHALGRSPHDRAWLLAHDTDPVDPAVLLTTRTLAARRVAGEPVAYITGHKEFFGLDLQVDARVLDPRADTELLVEWALELLPAHTRASVIDLGTGSGAIALALKAARPQWQVHALDVSADAIAVAQGNAQRLQLDIALRQGAWLSGEASRFDLIVSNPPYIASQDPHLGALVHEPLHALASGKEGLDDIRTLIAQAPTNLVPGGWLLLEHGYDQAAAVRNLLATAGFAGVQSRRDLAGIERCTGGQWP